MLAREHITIYWAMANAIKETAPRAEIRIKLIANISKEMAKTQIPFDPEKFNKACWNEDEL